MRITCDSIDYNAQQLIDAVVGLPFEYSDESNDADHQRILTIGIIRGILDMAKAMREVLDATEGEQDGRPYQP